MFEICGTVGVGIGLQVSSHTEAKNKQTLQQTKANRPLVPLQNSYRPDKVSPNGWPSDLKSSATTAVTRMPLQSANHPDTVVNNNNCSGERLKKWSSRWDSFIWQE